MNLNLNCITGYNDHLYKRIQSSIHEAKSIDLIISFLMESGVKLIQKDLEAIKDKNIPIRILTGNYLNITQPSALYLLRDILGDRVDLRFYNEKNRSFHPKAYIFEYENGGEIFIGSSNLSRSALTSGIEWNYRIDKEKNEDDYRFFKEMFEDLFLNESIIVDDNELERYSKEWKKPKVYPKQDDDEKNINYTYTEGNEGNVSSLFEPRGAQIEALYQLKKTREEGNDRALVVAATGIGKTYLSAFDSREFNRVLFVAHREEILKQAYESFKNVRLDKFIETNVSDEKISYENTVEKVANSSFNDKKLSIIDKDTYTVDKDTSVYNNFNINKRSSDYKKDLYQDGYNMGFFMNSTKDTDKDIVFASVQSLGKKEYLNENYFDKNYFDYIVVDEFHHAVTKYYQNIIDYFKPKFLLGLTATPNRLDNKDVFSICNYNTVYESSLKTSIDKGYLVPFRYYGIYDESVNYNNVEFKNGKYNKKELEEALSINKRANLILNHYKKYKSKSALGFCTSKSHAEFMAKYFNENGIKSVAVYSGSQGEYNQERSIALEKLKNEDINVIFSVDMFNEGLDVKNIDMVMFLRPTQSPTIFLQQLGRGLRKDKDKKYLNVLDFIGNYKKANLIPYLLTDQSGKKLKTHDFISNEEYFPEDCFIDFDFRLIDLFEKMERASKRTEELLIEEYQKVKNDLGHVPSRLDLFINIDDDLYDDIKKNRNSKKKRSELNIFKDYMQFLVDNNESENELSSLVGTLAHDFIKFIENTNMSKTYKIPVLLAFYNNGNMKLDINEDDLYKSFKDFYTQGSNATDMLKDKSTAEFKTWTEKQYISLAKRNPVKYLCKTNPEFFSMDGKNVCLNKDLEPYLNNQCFLSHFKDAIDFRVKEYYKIRSKTKNKK